MLRKLFAFQLTSPSFGSTTSRILLKSISRRKINPLIMENRFRVRFRLGLGYLNKTPISAPLFPKFKFPYVSLKIFSFSIVSLRATETCFGGNSIFHSKVMRRNDENFTLTFKLKMSNDFHNFSLFCCLSKCWNNSTYIPANPHQTDFKVPCFSETNVETILSSDCLRLYF